MSENKVEGWGCVSDVRGRGIGTSTVANEVVPNGVSVTCWIQVLLLVGAQPKWLGRQ